MADDLGQLYSENGRLDPERLEAAILKIEADARLPAEVPALSDGPFIATELGLVVNESLAALKARDDEGRDETWTACLRYARGLGRVLGGIHWIIGDFLNEMELVWGESYVQLAEATGFSVGTLYNDKYVCGAVPPGNRSNVAPLTFDHYKALASVKNPIAQAGWVKLCVDNQWTRRELRAELHPVTAELEQALAEMELRLEPGIEPTFANRLRAGRTFMLALQEDARDTDDQEGLNLVVSVLEDMIARQEE